ncbi:MAG: hypothetical protein ACK521_10175 [bacterium]
MVRDEAPFEVVHEIMCDDIGFSSQSGIAIELVQADPENAAIFFSTRQVAEPGVPMDSCKVMCAKVQAQSNQLQVKASCSYIIDQA